MTIFGSLDALDLGIGGDLRVTVFIFGVGLGFGAERINRLDEVED